MGAPKILTPTQVSFLAQLGFTDKNKDGKITRDELPNYDNPKLNLDQSTAFENLASVAGDKTAIDGDDIAKIMSDSKALAALMSNDPEYRGDIVSSASLQANKREVKSDNTKRDARDGIPPVAFKRLVYYTQMGLNFLSHSKTLSINGVYDSKTVAKVAEFQRLMALDKDNKGRLMRDGTFIDRSTLGSLILRLQYTPSEIVGILNTVKAAGHPENLQKSNPADLDKLLLGLQYLYPNEVGPWRTEGRLDEARSAFQKHFDAYMVGPRVAMQMATYVLRMGYLK